MLLSLLQSLRKHKPHKSLPWFRPKWAGGLRRWAWLPLACLLLPLVEKAVVWSQVILCPTWLPPPAYDLSVLCWLSEFCVVANVGNLLCHLRSGGHEEFLCNETCEFEYQRHDQAQTIFMSSCQNQLPRAAATSTANAMCKHSRLQTSDTAISAAHAPSTANGFVQQPCVVCE